VQKKNSSREATPSLAFYTLAHVMIQFLQNPPM